MSEEKIKKSLNVNFFLVGNIFCSSEDSSTIEYTEGGLRPKEGDTQASAKEAGNKPILSAALPLHCLPTQECSRQSRATKYILFIEMG